MGLHSGRALVLYAILGTWTLHSDGAIQIANFSSLTNDRFTNDASFVADALDLSGVAIADDGKWVTMLSSNVFISANHYHPGTGTSVTFYSGNDASGLSATRTIDGGQRIGSTDLWIGTLDSPLSNDFAFYGFATQDTTSLNSNSGAASSENFTESPYALETAYVFGRSDSSWSTSQDMAVGRNVLDYWLDNVTAGGTSDDALVATVNPENTGNYVNYEAYLQSGDSGAPLLSEDGTIVGLNWFIGTLGSNAINGFSYLGNYDAEIQAFLDSNSPVPEPATSGLLLACLALGFTCFRRRRRAPPPVGNMHH